MCLMLVVFSQESSKVWLKSKHHVWTPQSISINVCGKHPQHINTDSFRYVCFISIVYSCQIVIVLFFPSELPHTFSRRFPQEVQTIICIWCSNWTGYNSKKSLLCFWKRISQNGNPWDFVPIETDQPGTPDTEKPDTVSTDQPGDVETSAAGEAKAAQRLRQISFCNQVIHDVYRCSYQTCDSDIHTYYTYIYIHICISWKLWNICSY